MTIIVRRRGKKETGIEHAIKAARRISNKKITDLRELLTKLDKEENRLKAAAIRRYAKKHEYVLNYHRKPWIFWIFKNLGVSLPPGYYAIVNKVLENIVAV